MRRIMTIAGVVWVEMLRKKDFYVLFILLGVLLFFLMSMNIFGLGSTVRYLMDIGLLMSWLFSLILAVTLTGRQLPQEQEKGTIFPLLSKPITRAELLLGKWWGAFSAVSVATILFYAVVLFVARAPEKHPVPSAIIQAWVLHVVTIGMACAIALAFSTRMSTGAASSLSFVGLAACHLVVPRIPMLLVHGSGFSNTALMVLYYAMPHLELFDMRQRVVHDWGAVSWPVFMAVVLYGLVLTATILLIAWLSYRKRAFKRGAVT